MLEAAAGRLGAVCPCHGRGSIPLGTYPATEEPGASQYGVRLPLAKRLHRQANPSNAKLASLREKEQAARVED